MEVLEEKEKKPKPNYYLILPNGVARSIYIKNIEAAKSLIMDMEHQVKLIKIKR